MAQNPPPPQRSSHYTIVCGGTWLNRKSWDDAKAQFRFDSRIAHQQQDQAFGRQIVQQQEQSQERQSNFQRFFNRLPLPRPIRQFFNQLGQGIVTFQQRLQTTVRRQLQGIQRRVNQLARYLRTVPFTGSRLTAMTANVLSFFLGHRREAKGGASETDRHREKQNADTQALPELFSTQRVESSQGSTLQNSER